MISVDECKWMNWCLLLPPSGEGVAQNGRLHELGLADALAGRVVKQDRVPVGFPNGRQLDAAGAVQAKEDAARSLGADQNPLGDQKRADFQFVLVANGLVDISSKVVQVVDLERGSRHEGRGLLRIDAERWKGLPAR